MFRVGTPQRIPLERWHRYFDLRKAGVTKYAACEDAGISLKAAALYDKNPNASSGTAAYRTWVIGQSVPEVRSGKALPVEARRALGDFEFFRRRYFGHVSMPWHVQAAVKMIELLERPEKSFVVVNAPPGGGKSALFTHDLILWALMRNRNLRTLVGTYTESTGSDYLLKIRRSLERTSPVEGDEMDKAAGRAVDAVTTLSHDFGRFRPEGNTYWSADKLVLAREGGAPAHQKEASVASYGRRSGFLGGRYNLVVWDDVVTDTNSRTPEQQAEMARWWRNTAESRLEPGGLLILQGQRLGPNDLYRYALDLKDVAAGFDLANSIDDTDFDPAILPGKYHHIIYKAHDETKCAGGDHRHPDHTIKARPWPGGCLLDPTRLTYRDLRMAAFNDPKSYATIYQQEDTDPGSVLINPLWINGGIDANNALYPGCYDKYRQLGAWPDGLSGDVYSVVTADPSASNYWALGWWAYQPKNSFAHLVDLRRKRMEAPDLLDWNHARRAWTGHLEDWWQASAEIDRRITTVIVEANAAQRFLLQYDHAVRWAMTRGVELIAHQTQINKSDPKFGIGALAPHFRHGRVRLPGHPLSRPELQPMVYELTHYPDAPTTDTVMMTWFLYWSAERLFVPRMDKPYAFARPSWLRDSTRGLRAV